MSAVEEAELLARVTLSCGVEPGDGVTASLVRQLGAERALRRQLVPKPDSCLAERLEEVDPARQLEQAHKCGIRFVVPGDPEWPRGLDDLDHALGDDAFGGTPPGLWVRGPMPLTELAGSVAAVGSRAASVYGVEMTRAIVDRLALARVPVVSGGALGIDVTAHDAALRAGGATVAVLACGVDRAYPAANGDLLRHLAAEFAVVSEQPPGSAPTRPRFLARNRLIAALTRGTVVTEAAQRSGALNTAGWAEALGRPVMAVPGPVTSYTSRGVHQLLRDGRAVVVTDGAQILEVVGEAGDHLLDVPRGEVRPRDALSPREAKVLEWVPVGSPAAVDSIARRSSLHVRETDGALRRLEAKGFVRLEGDGWRLAEDR